MQFKLPSRGLVSQTRTTKPIGERRSVGRSQPLAAATQQTLNPTNPPHPHTFFHPNVPGTQFDWLVHLDRRPISIGELLHVSGFKPQEITQTFVDSTKKFQHVAPWKFDQSIDNAANNTVAKKARLFRALEYFTVGDRSNWSSNVPASVPVTNILPPSSGGRRPGMINVNTIWDTEILSALTDPPVTAGDPNAVNFFGQAEVGQAWSAINQRRRQALVATRRHARPRRSSVPRLCQSRARTIRTIRRRRQERSRPSRASAARSWPAISTIAPSQIVVTSTTRC